MADENFSDPFGILSNLIYQFKLPKEYTPRTEEVVVSVPEPDGSGRVYPGSEGFHDFDVEENLAYQFRFDPEIEPEINRIIENGFGTTGDKIIEVGTGTTGDTITETGYIDG